MRSDVRRLGEPLYYFSKAAIGVAKFADGRRHSVPYSGKSGRDDIVVGHKQRNQIANHVSRRRKTMKAAARSELSGSRLAIEDIKAVDRDRLIGLLPAVPSTSSLSS